MSYVADVLTVDVRGIKITDSLINNFNNNFHILCLHGTESPKDQILELLKAKWSIYYIEDGHSPLSTALAIKNLSSPPHGPPTIQVSNQSFKVPDSLPVASVKITVWDKVSYCVDSYFNPKPEGAVFFHTTKERVQQNPSFRKNMVMLPGPHVGYEFLKANPEVPGQAYYVQSPRQTLLGKIYTLAAGIFFSFYQLRFSEATAYDFENKRGLKTTLYIILKPSLFSRIWQQAQGVYIAAKLLLSGYHPPAG